MMKKVMGALVVVLVLLVLTPDARAWYFGTTTRQSGYDFFIQALATVTTTRVNVLSVVGGRVLAVDDVITAVGDFPSGGGSFHVDIPRDAGQVILLIDTFVGTLVRFHIQIGNSSWTFDTGEARIVFDVTD